MADDKWKFLYEYSRRCLDEDIARFQVIDAKSGSFLTLVSAVFAVFAIVATVSAWAFQNMMPPTDILTWLLFLSITLTFIALAWSWSLLFRAIKLTKAPRLPLSDQLIQLIKNHGTSDIYFCLTKTCRNALDENRKLVTIKGDFIAKAYKGISLSAFLVATDAVIIVVIKFLE